MITYAQLDNPENIYINDGKWPLISCIRTLRDLIIMVLVEQAATG